jgi:hypothetical protein
VGLIGHVRLIGHVGLIGYVRLRSSLSNSRVHSIARHRFTASATTVTIIVAPAPIIFLDGGGDGGGDGNSSGGGGVSDPVPWSRHTLRSRFWRAVQALRLHGSLHRGCCCITRSFGQDGG